MSALFDAVRACSLSLLAGAVLHASDVTAGNGKVIDWRTVPAGARCTACVLTLHDGAGDTPLLSFDTNLTNMPDGVTVGYWEDGANPVNLGLAAPVTITPAANRPATISLTISQTAAGASIPAGILRIKATRPS